MPKYTGTVTEFIVNLFAAQPDMEWRIAEIVAAGDNKWNAANVANSLARMFKAGKVKKNVNGGAWWSAASAAPVNVKPAKAAAPASTTAASPNPVPSAVVGEPKPAEAGSTAAAFILDLLKRHPDYEMQVSDIWEECDRKWKRQTIFNTLDKLVAGGKVARVKDDGKVWFSIAG